MALSALENVFPPVPADIAVALGAFLARRGERLGGAPRGAVLALATSSRPRARTSSRAATAAASSATAGAQAHAAASPRRARGGLRSVGNRRHLPEPLPSRRAGGGDAVRRRRGPLARPCAPAGRGGVRDLVRVPRGRGLRARAELGGREDARGRREPCARDRRGRPGHAGRRLAVAPFPPSARAEPQGAQAFDWSDATVSWMRSPACRRRTSRRGRRPAAPPRGPSSRRGRPRAGRPSSWRARRGSLSANSSSRARQAASKPSASATSSARPTASASSSAKLRPRSAMRESDGGWTEARRSAPPTRAAARRPSPR